MDHLISTPFSIARSAASYGFDAAENAAAFGVNAARWSAQAVMPNDDDYDNDVGGSNACMTSMISPPCFDGQPAENNVMPMVSGTCGCGKPLPCGCGLLPAVPLVSAKKGLSIGIAVGIVVVIGLLIALLVLIVRYGKRCCKTAVKRSGCCRPPSCGAGMPFASGLPITVSTDGTGAAIDASILGFGTSAVGLTFGTGGTVDLTGGPATAIGLAYNAACSMRVSTITATFSSTDAVDLGAQTVFVTVQLYHAAADSNVFAPVPNAFVDIAVTGLLAVGTAFAGRKRDICANLIGGDRYVLVVTASSTAAATLSGYVSAGVGTK